MFCLPAVQFVLSTNASCLQCAVSPSPSSLLLATVSIWGAVVFSISTDSEDSVSVTVPDGCYGYLHALLEARISAPPSLRHLLQTHQLVMSFKKIDCKHDSVWRPIIVPFRKGILSCISNICLQYLLIFNIYIFQLTFIVTKFVNFSLCRYLDGFSVFEVGSDGLIHCHRLHKVL